MMRSLYTAATGMYAQQLNVDTIAHNISNVNTTGFKQERVEFQDLIYQTIRRPVSTEELNEPVGKAVGLGVNPVVVNTLFQQGNFIDTENPTDVAINGPAFFMIEIPGRDNPVYTRDGSFKIDAEGSLVTAEGYYVMGVDTFEETAREISISDEGIITYKVADSDEIIEAGQIMLSKFINPAGLNRIGSNFYEETANSGEAIEWDPTVDPTVTLAQGYLEASNVKVVEEMVDLITAQRAYEFNSKLIQSSDEMLQTATNLYR